MKPAITFIHGMFLNSKSWEKWVTWFQERGYTCEVPAWPFHSGDPAEIRRQPPWELGTLGLATVHSFYRDFLKSKQEHSILIGHSMGGLLVQKLVAEGLARAGVCICPAAPNKMLSFDWGFLRNGASITNPFAGDEPYEMTEALFHQNFGNTMSERDSAAAFAKYAMPESRKVLRDLMGAEGTVDVEIPHVPLLFVAAEKDEVIPASLVKRNSLAYTDERSHRECVEFSSRGHFICGQDGWEEVALGISNWLDSHVHSNRS